MPHAPGMLAADRDVHGLPDAPIAMIARRGLRDDRLSEPQDDGSAARLQPAFGPPGACREWAARRARADRSRFQGGLRRGMAQPALLRETAVCCMLGTLRSEDRAVGQLWRAELA